MTLPRPRTLILSVLSLLAVALIAAPASARRGAKGVSGPEPTEEMKAVHQLRKQIVATELVQALDLDADQKKQLAALIREVTGRHAAARAERQEAAPQLAEILGDYLADVQANGVPSAKTAAALQSFRDEHRPDKGDRKEQMKATKEQMQSLLSEAQIDALRNFKPSLAPEHGAGGPEGEERPPRMERRERGGEERGMGRERGERRRGAKKVRQLLLSPEMLEALER